MRLKIVADCGLSLLLACVPATAQQRSRTCAEQERQIRSLQDEVARLTDEAVAKKTACVADRRSETCGPYAVALTRQREKQADLKTLTDDPGWRACPGSAVYRTQDVPPSGRDRNAGTQNTNPGSTQTNGRDPSTVGTNQTSERGASAGDRGQSSFRQTSSGTSNMHTASRTSDYPHGISKANVYSGHHGTKKSSTSRPHASNGGHSRLPGGHSGGRGGHHHR